MSLSLSKSIECKLVGEEEQKELFHKFNDEERQIFLEIVREENKRSYLKKKSLLKRLKFRILKTGGMALFKDSIGITSGIFQKYLSIPGYMIESIKNNVRISKGIEITTKNMTEKNFSVLINQVAEEKIYENYILEYLEDMNMQKQFRDSFITYKDEHNQLKEQLKQSKQRMKRLSKIYVKEKQI